MGEYEPVDSPVESVAARIARAVEERLAVTEKRVWTEGVSRERITVLEDALMDTEDRIRGVEMSLGLAFLLIAGAFIMLSKHDS